MSVDEAEIRSKFESGGSQKVRIRSLFHFFYVFGTTEITGMDANELVLFCSLLSNFSLGWQIRVDQLKVGKGLVILGISLQLCWLMVWMCTRNSARIKVYQCPARRLNFLIELASGFKSIVRDGYRFTGINVRICIFKWVYLKQYAPCSHQDIKVGWGSRSGTDHYRYKGTRSHILWQWCYPCWWRWSFVCDDRQRIPYARMMLLVF